MNRLPKILVDNSEILVVIALWQLITSWHPDWQPWQSSHKMFTKVRLICRVGSWSCGFLVKNIWTVSSSTMELISKSTYTSNAHQKVIEYDELREDVMIWVLETRIFESDQNEFQSVVPTLYVVKICGNCILNAKKSKKQFKRPISLFSLCAVESSQLKWPIFDGNSRNENAFFSMFFTSMT